MITQTATLDVRSESNLCITLSDLKIFVNTRNQKMDNIFWRLVTATPLNILGAPAVERTISRNINWGEQKVETVPNGASWKLIYHRFDGRDFEIATADETNAYFKVRVIANQVTITTTN